MPAAMKPLPGTKYGPAVLAVASCKFELSIKRVKKYCFRTSPHAQTRQRPAVVLCLQLPEAAGYSNQLT